MCFFKFGECRRKRVRRHQISRAESEAPIIATQFCQSYEDPLHRGQPVGNTNCHELLPSGAVAIPLQKRKSPARTTGL
jgi:hypothetical protein